MKRRIITLAVLLTACILAFAACGQSVIENTVKVNFDLNYQGAPQPPEAKTLKVGEKYGALAVPERTGYDFSGWYFDADGNGRVTKSTTVKDGADHTLYAKWQELDGSVEEPIENPWPDSPYKIPLYADDRSMLIFAYAPYYGDRSQAAYDDIAEGGFTALFPVDNETDFRTNPGVALDMLNKAYKAGMKVIVRDTGLSTQGVWETGNSKLYKDHPAFIGNDINDEPHRDEYSWIKTKHSAYKPLFPDKVFFVNLFLMGNDTWMNTVRGTVNYEAYLQECMDTGASWLSYDCYALLYDKPWNNAAKKKIVRKTYFENMEIVARVAKRNSVPWHNYIQSISQQKGGYESNTPFYSPSEQELRWQIAAAMAYGIYAFSYFTYATPPDPNYGDDALVNRAGEKTPLWGYAQTVNREVLAWDNVYLRYKWLDTTKIQGSNGGSTTLISGLKTQLPYSQIDGIDGITTVEHLLLGIFEDAAKNKGFMLTNARQPSDNKTADVTVTFDGAYKGVLVYEKGVPRIIDLDASGKAAIALEPGEGKFMIPLKNK